MIFKSFFGIILCIYSVYASGGKLEHVEDGGDDFAANYKYDDSIKIATYEEVKDLPNHPEVLLIDVRPKTEISITGTIPTSINIPLATVGEALNLSDDEFETKFSREKPTEDTPLIFTCTIGVRAEQAAKIAIKEGFTNVKSYKGSWNDWAAHEGLKKQTYYDL